MKSVIIALFALAFTLNASAAKTEKTATKKTVVKTAKAASKATAQSAGKKAVGTPASPAVQRGHAKLGTSFKFDGTALHGKYQNTPSTTATVENDKYLDDLLGARQNFNDRTAKDQERN